MVRFPETIQSEVEAISRAASAAEDYKAKLAEDADVQIKLERLRVDHKAKELLKKEIEAEDTPALEMMTLADYHNSAGATGPADLIEGVVKDNGVCIVIGPSGAGKSTVAMQMIPSFQTGTPWMGQPVIQLSGASGVLSYDMDARLLAAYTARYPNLDMRKVSIVNAYKKGHPLAVPEMRAKIARTWKAMQVEVVVIDSFGASFFGQDQNDAAATMAHYRDLGKFALTEVGARALIVIAHSLESDSEKIRGSSVHHNVADSIAAVSADDPKDPLSPRRVRMVKYRAAPGQHMMNPVMVGAPDPVTHLIDVDTGAMTMKGMSLPPSAVAMAFPDVSEEPDITDHGDDDL